MNRTAGRRDNPAPDMDSLKAAESARIGEDTMAKKKAVVVPRKQNVFEMTTILINYSLRVNFPSGNRPIRNVFSWTFSPTFGKISSTFNGCELPYNWKVTLRGVRVDVHGQLVNKQLEFG